MIVQELEAMRRQLTYIKNEMDKWDRYWAEKRRLNVISPQQVNRVKRKLFGPVDSDENERFLEDQIQRQDVIEKERWNYDFKKEEPVDNKNGAITWKIETDKSRNKLALLRAPKPRRRLGQSKITEYLPVRKSAGGEQKMKLIIENITDREIHTSS